MKRLASFVLSGVLAASGLVGAAAIAPAALAASVNVGSIDCNAVTGTSASPQIEKLATGLSAGDSINLSYVNCNQWDITWTSADFTTTFGSSGSFKENGNNAETRAFSNYQGSAAENAVLITMTKGTSELRITQGEVPLWTAKSPPDGAIGTAYTDYTFVATGGSNYTVTSGSLPPGLSLNSGTGVLSGTPTLAGDYSFVVDAGVATTTGTLSVTIANVPITKVTICHRTRATTNPYVMITVSVNSVIGSGGRNGHQDHNTTRTNSTNPTGNGISPGSGPFDVDYNTSTGYPSNRKWWGDIIPPFSYDGGTFSGLNWSPDWNVPNPTTDGNPDWLEDSEFAAAVRAGSTSSVYYKAAAQCMDLSAGTQSTKSSEVDTPEKYFNVAIENGEDPDSVVEDLQEQEALDPTNPSPGSPRTIPSQTTLEQNYAATADVQTDPATDVTRTTATLNGELKTGTTWTSWTYEWTDDVTAFTGGTASSHDYTAGTDPSNSVGAGPRNPEYEVTGLTCATTYYFRVIGTDGSTTSYGLVETFTTAACANGGGGNNNGGGNGNGNSGGNGNGNGNGGGTTTTPVVTTPPTASNPGLGRGRPTRVTLPPAALSNPSGVTNPGNSGGSNPGNSTGSNPGNSGGSNPGNSGGTTNGGTTGGGDQPADPRPNRPRQVTPTVSVPPPPGDEWVPEALRLEDPESGEETLTVVDDQGTWEVDPRTGGVTFTPAPDFTGTAVLNVRLVARSGAIQIHPIRVRVVSTARILVIEGDVPSDILGGVFRRWR